MSRIGTQPIEIKEGVSVEVSENVVFVKGKLGELSQEVRNVEITIDDGILKVKSNSQSKQDRAYQGLYRSLISNMIEGVTKGFSKELELVGVGYRASNKGQALDLSLGFSHNIVMGIPKEVSIETKMEKGKPPYIKLSSYDKQLLGMVAAKIRSFRKPEPYKGKGVRFVGEQIRRKAGKAAGSK